MNISRYTIELTHGPFSWTIKRRYKHFSTLHQQLSIFRTSLNIPFPMRSHKEKRATIKNAAIQMADENRIKELQKSASFKNGASSNGHTSYSRATGSVARAASSPAANTDQTADTTRGSRRKKRKKRKLPRFPQRPESLVMVEAMPERIQQLEDYLYNLLNISLYRNHHETVSKCFFLKHTGELFWKTQLDGCCEKCIKSLQDLFKIDDLLPVNLVIGPYSNR